MNIKKILFISLIAVAIISSVSLVSAGWFDSTVDIDGIQFNIPSGYDEGDANDASIEGFIKDEAGDYKNYTVETKVFEKDTPDPDHPGVAVFPHYIIVSVISDSKELSLDDVNNNSDYQEKTVNNKIGLEKNETNMYDKVAEEFYYLEDGKLIKVYLYDPEDIELENVIVE